MIIPAENLPEPTATENAPVPAAPVAPAPAAPQPDTTNAVDALAAEVAAENAANPGYTEVPLGPDGQTVRIKSPLDWRSSAQTALRGGDFETWAESCLVEPDYEQVWVPMDPTLREINDLFGEWGRITGQGSAGKSPNSLRSLRRTPRR